MADQRTMTELLRAPTEGYAEAILVPLILAKHFKLKHSLINMMTTDQFFRLEKDNHHDHIHWFNNITSIIKYKDVPNSAIKLMLFPFSFAGAARRWLKKEPPRSILTWEDLVSKFINEFFPPSRTTNLQNEISNFQQWFDESFHEQTSAVTTAMTAILKQFQATSPPASVKSVEEICVTCGGAHPYYQCLAADGNTFPESWVNIQGYVSAAAVNYNQASMSNQTNELKNMMASFFQMNTTSTSSLGPLPSNTIANPKGELKAITTQSGLVLDGPSVPMPLTFINPEEDKRIEETLTDPELDEFTIKVPPPLVQNAKSPYQRNYVKMHKALLSNKEKLLELENTPLNENCLAVILKKLPEKLGDPRKDLSYGPFLWTAHALINVHGEEMILRDVINPLSGSTTSSPSNHLLEELAFITFPLGNDDLTFDIESDLREIEYLLNHDPNKEMDNILKDSVDEGNLANPNVNLVDTIPQMFTDEHTLDYSSLPLCDDFDDDLFELESNNDDAYDDPFDSKED
uniref:Reverse transcriptase domain-containing protein n=1 Tax=Tanacetum cinerariifolium TaxID=118510 RepID=A0A699HAS1_TANCI|nr:reverse transcriptase domain-containing protein [Tanacetum cinerariifolium]